MKEGDSVNQAIARLLALAAEMEATGKILQKLDVEHAFAHGGEMLGAADTAREWALELQKEAPPD